MAPFLNQYPDKKYQSLRKVVDPKKNELLSVAPQDGVNRFHQTQ